MKDKDLEEMLGEYFGCDSAYYPEQEVKDIIRAIEIGYKFKAREIKKIASKFFYEGMTFEQFSNQEGGVFIPEGMPPSVWLSNKLLQL